MTAQTPSDEIPGKAHYRARNIHANPREALQSAWRYSVFVKVMKGMLPIVAMGLVIAVLSYVMQPREQARPVLTIEDVGKIENDLAMVKPELNGADKDGLPFTINAASAVPEARGSDHIVLENVDAKIALKSGGNMYVTAAHGIADTKNQVFDVSGGIHVTTDDGYEVRTESASADFKAGTIQGDQPVTASGKLGTVTARRFTVNRTTNQLHFTGNVRTVLYGTTLPAKGKTK